MASERFVLQSADVELAANDRAQQTFIVRVEQVEPGVTPTFQFRRLGADSDDVDQSFRS